MNFSHDHNVHPRLQHSLVKFLNIESRFHIYVKCNILVSQVTFDLQRQWNLSTSSSMKNWFVCQCQKRSKKYRDLYFFKDKKLTCGHYVSLNSSEMVSIINLTQLQMKPLSPNTKVLFCALKISHLVLWRSFECRNFSPYPITLLERAT